MTESIETGSAGPDTPDDPAPDGLAIRRKRAIFRSWHRGTREADLLMGRFADRHVPEFGAAEMAAYERLLEIADPDLYDWMSGRLPVPPDHDDAVMRLLQGFNPARDRVS